ncbi:MAG: FecR domain-containing protein, partial [Tannerellaceae bacterium]|nr:FecR domain-containing protein [Tannerellaceae bacterium]
TLPDGTALHINSGSHVVFPEKFADHQREIFVNGEVFLEVAPDTKCPFLIHTKNMTVTVTGTSLNISAYESETQSVVLVSGAVTVKTAGKKEIPLLPNQMLSHTENTTSVTEVEVADYICWKEGYLQCNEDNLPSLMKKISRFYGKTITCDPLLLNQQGTGKLDLKEDFEQLLNGLKEIFPIEIVKGDESYHIRHSN